MSVIVKSPKCRNGMLKNHFSTVKDESVEWKDGVAEVSEKAWNVLKSIPGYLREPKKPTVTPIEPGTVVDIKEVMRENSENLELLSKPPIVEKPEIITETIIEPEPIVDEAPVIKTAVKSDKIPEITEPIIDKTPPDIIGKPVTVDNTVKEIRAFAKDNGIALGNAQSKKDLIKKIKKHFG